MNQFVITLFCKISLVFAHLLSNSLKNEVMSSTQIRTVVTNLAQKLFVDESSLGVLLLDHDVNYIVSEIHLPVVVYGEEEVISCKTTLIDLDGYMFVIPQSSYITHKIIPALQCYNKTTLKLNTKYVLIICMQSDHCFSTKYYLQMFHEIWTNYGLINVIVLTSFRKEFRLHPIVLAYNPFIRNDSFKTGILNIFESAEYLRGELEKRFFNMYGYTLNAIMFPYNISVHSAFLNKPGSIKGGIDLSFRWTLERQFNVCFAIHLPRDGKYHGVSVNGTSNGALLDVINNNVDIALNAKILRWHGTMRIQFLMPRLDSAFVVMVKKKDPIEGWEIILHVFQWQVWAWIVNVTFLSCIMSWMLAKVYLLFAKTNQHQHRPEEAVWMMLKSTVSLSVLRPPRLNHHRILMTTSLWSSVIIVNLFMAQLFYLIKTKPRMANIDTLQELLDSNLPIFTSTLSFLSAFDGLKNSSLSGLVDRLHFKRFSEAPDGRGYPNKITEDYALLYSSTVFQYQKVAEPSEFTETVQCLKELVYQYYLGLYMPIGSIYHKHFYMFSMRMFELGFTSKWFQEYLSFIRESQYKPNPKGIQSKTDSDNLTLRDFKLAFLIMFVGLGISTVCFLFEVLLFKYM